MQSEIQGKGKKRSKSYYRKCAYGGKKQCLNPNPNILEPGIRGFLVMCNHNEKSAVRESYNILNEYANILYGQDKASSAAGDKSSQKQDDCDFVEESSDEEEDIEKALKKEVEGMKSVSSSERRFQNVMTKAKNCVFIRTSLENPVRIAHYFMEDIGVKKLRRARFAARILPIIGTCKANTSDVEKLASEVLRPIFSSGGDGVPESFTILFKSRNNNGSCCGREGVVSSLIKIVKDINPHVKFTWSDYSMAVLVEIVCTVCCIGVAPDFIRLRKYNLQELTKGVSVNENLKEEIQDIESKECEVKLNSKISEETEHGEKVTRAPEEKSVTKACVEEGTRELKEKSVTEACVEEGTRELKEKSVTEACVEGDTRELKEKTVTEACVEGDTRELKEKTVTEACVEESTRELKEKSVTEAFVEGDTRELKETQCD